MHGIVMVSCAAATSLPRARTMCDTCTPFQASSFPSTSLINWHNVNMAIISHDELDIKRVHMTCDATALKPKASRLRATKGSHAISHQILQAALSICWLSCSITLLIVRV